MFIDEYQGTFQLIFRDVMFWDQKEIAFIPDIMLKNKGFAQVTADIVKIKLTCKSFNMTRDNFLFFK